MPARARERLCFAARRRYLLIYKDPSRCMCVDPLSISLLFALK